MGARFYRWFFYAIALEDLILGVVFFIWRKSLLELFRMVQPSAIVYVHLPAGYVFVQGVGYWLVAQDVVGNRSIVKLGLGMKLVYIFIAAYCVFLRQFPWFFISLAVIDIFIVYFLVRYLRQSLHTLQAA
jgi:hypothetical protein